MNNTSSIYDFREMRKKKAELEDLAMDARAAVHVWRWARRQGVNIPSEAREQIAWHAKDRVRHYLEKRAVHCMVRRCVKTAILRKCSVDA